ncbi:MAG: PAS domain-containing protein, partial [Terracidiphilus sp.]
MTTQINLIAEVGAASTEPVRWPHTTTGAHAADEPQMVEHMGRLFDVTHDLLAVVGIDDDRIRFLNASWEGVLGYSREELMKDSLAVHLHPDDLGATLEDIEKVRKGQPTTGFINRFRCKDGRYRWLSWSSVASAQHACFYVSARDITEQKRSEERAQRLAQALEHNSEMISMAGADGRAVFVNRALLQATGYHEDDLLGNAFAATLVSPNNPLGLKQEYLAQLEKEGKWSGECLLRRKDGTDFPALLSVSVLRDSEGRATGTFAISQDLSEQRRMENR